ncbi:MAG: hypothetical protein AAGH79_04025 [Bacteroidota bacterium]
MGITEILSRKRSTSEITTKEWSKAEACPNCWGRQAYDHKYVEFVQDRQKDHINQTAEGRKAFIEQFVEDHITGIRLKREGDQLTCPTCKTGYKHVPSKTN